MALSIRWYRLSNCPVGPRRPWRGNSVRYQPVRIVRILRLISFAYFALVFLTACVARGADEQPRRILLLEGLTATQPAGVRTLEAFKNRLKERGVENIEMFIEFLELGRFPGQAQETRTARFLAKNIPKIRQTC